MIYHVNYIVIQQHNFYFVEYPLSNKCHRCSNYHVLILSTVYCLETNANANANICFCRFILICLFKIIILFVKGAAMTMALLSARAMVKKLIYHGVIISKNYLFKLESLFCKFYMYTKYILFHIVLVLGHPDWIAFF